MIEPAKENPYVGLDLSVFDHNLAIPRHRWYEFKEGFSESLVRTAVKDILTSGCKKPRILDPFVGSGTTVVTAGRLGLEATGIEVNPFLAFAARAKCAPNGWNRKTFLRQMQQILYASRHELMCPLEGLSTFTETARSKKWLFNRSVLRGFTALEQALLQAGRYRHPLRLVLFASLMKCCNAKRDGKCLRYRKDWRTKGFNSADLREAFESRAEAVFEDISEYPFDARGLSVIQGDARDCLEILNTESYDLIITSPPYLNSFDYSDVYRPELFAGGFVKTNAELRQIRLRTIRSHVQVAWEPSQTVSSPLIPPLVSRIAQKRLWDKRLPDMVQSYFADMADVLRKTARLVRPKGRAWVVVSTSAYGGVEIPVDLILADVATRNGWGLVGVNVLRQLRASGQHWSHLKTGAKFPLRESLIILERTNGRKMGKRKHR